MRSNIIIQIQLDHTIYASRAKIQTNAQDLLGKMVDCNNNPIKRPYPNIIGEVNCRDTFEVQTLLEAACVDSLDTPSIGDGGKNISRRDSGLVLIAFVKYSNTETFNLNKITYSISVGAINNTQYKADQAQFVEGIGDVNVIGRHGVRVVFLQVGEIGKFDFQELLLTFVSGMGLLAIATVIVDILATRILSWRETYGQLKYQETPIPEELENHSDEESSLLRGQATYGESYDKYINTS